MKQVVIASDSTTDLSPALIEQYNIKILPLCVHMGGKQYADGVDITPDGIYSHYRQTGELPKTSAANIADCAAFFEAVTKDGSEMVFFTISSEMSSTHENAVLAAQQAAGVHVVDTRNLSTGGGLLVLSACEMAQAGKSAPEIAQACRHLAEQVDASFVIDDLEFLRKGGRCSALAAFGANLLHLKPCIEVRHGKMGVGKKYQGRFGKTLAKYIRERIGDGADLETNHVFVTHAGCDPAIVEQCVEQVRALGLFRQVHLTRAGCTVSAHCGANTLGVLFIRKTPLA